MKNRHKIFALSAIIVMICTLFAPAAETGWYETEGGKMRVVVEPYMPGATQIRGIIDIELAPGWYTYWRDPGSGGIPPSIQIADTKRVKNVHIEFPAPILIKSSYGDHTGYKNSVRIPFTLELSGPAYETTLQFRVMIGICKDICVPVFEDFILPIEEAKGSSRAGAAVMDAFASLPRAPEDLGISVKVDEQASSKKLEVSVSGADRPLALFISSKNGTQFKIPQPVFDGGNETIYQIEPLYTHDMDINVDLIVTGKSASGAFEKTFKGIMLKNNTE